MGLTCNLEGKRYTLSFLVEITVGSDLFGRALSPSS